MEKKKAIMYKNLGIVSLEMNPNNPKTKFDEMLPCVISEGKIYQIAMFNSDDTKFRLIADIADDQNVIYEVTSFTSYEKLNKGNSLIDENGLYDKRLIYSAANTVTTNKVKIKKYDRSSHVLEGLDHVPHDEDFYLLDFLVENNKRFVGMQIEHYKAKFREMQDFDILSPEF